MTKSRFSFLVAFGALLTLAANVDAQSATSIRNIQPGIAAPTGFSAPSGFTAPSGFGATSVVESTPFTGGTSFESAAPVYQSAPAVSHSGCTSCGQSAGFSAPPQVTGPHGKSGDCSLPGPTVAPGFPQLPIASCCNNIGRLNIPPLKTPLRYDTPPIGRSVGRPLFGAWSGY